MSSARVTFHLTSPLLFSVWTVERIAPPSQEAGERRESKWQQNTIKTVMQIIYSINKVFCFNGGGVNTDLKVSGYSCTVWMVSMNVSWCVLLAISKKHQLQMQFSSFSFLSWIVHMVYLQCICGQWIDALEL